jgi:hypothetical protein
MCLPGQPPAPPRSAADAVAMARAALGWLAAADPTTLTSSEQAECLRGLERAAAVQTAARSKVLSAFCSGRGYEDDGQYSAKSWLRWQTRVTPGAAAGVMGWMRRLAAHPGVRDALAGAEISESWARQVCEWSDLLPERHRLDADQILLAAAAGGAGLADLGALAEEMRRRLAPVDRDDDGFDDRRVRLSKTDRDPPLGLGHRAHARRHHHRHQPRRQPDLPQPRATHPRRRLTAGSAGRTRQPLTVAAGLPCGYARDHCGPRAAIAVLLEPTTVVAKAWDHIEKIGRRATWAPGVVLLTGAGPIGLLAALLSTQRGYDTYVLDLVTEGRKPDMVRRLGATYVNPGELGRAAAYARQPDDTKTVLNFSRS